MQTYSGRFYPLDPRPEEFEIEDIALSLSRINRYNGHNDAPISVAQHSVQCVDLVDIMEVGTEEEVHQVKRYMLMHDATEAYVGDMVRPLKSIIPQFGEIEAGVWKACVERFEIKLIDPKTIKFYDNLACSWEKRNLCTSYEEWPRMPVVPDWVPKMASWSAKVSERKFIEMFNELWGDDFE